MEISPVFALCFLTSCLIRANHASQEDQELTELRMPGAKPSQPNEYICTALAVDPLQEHYLVRFTPHGSMETAHHMLLFGCEAPGSSAAAWNCGEMNAGSSEYEQAPPCQSGSEIIYAWAKDAPELTLPEGVGFKVGGGSGVNYLVLQVHYMHHMDHNDFSGLTLHSTPQQMPRTAATLLMVTDGEIAAHTEDNFDAACEINENVELHPFAFRTHTHKLGKVVSGWKVVRGDSNDQWQLIGKKNPQLPQMFYDVKDPNMVINQGDVVAARCHMKNDGDKAVAIGPTGDDEMCNFYMMYWVDGDQTLSDNTCQSPGPPSYHLETEAGLKNVPEDQMNKL